MELLYNSKDEAFKEYRKRKLHHDLNQHDTNNIRAIKAIEGVDPKYAKHMFLGNRLLEQFIKKQGGGLDLLDQPVCPHCEKPCAWDIEKGAYCFSCNKSIPSDKVYTVSQYLLAQMKNVDIDTLHLYVKGAEVNEIIR